MDVPNDMAVDLNLAIQNVCQAHGVPVEEWQLDDAAYAVIDIVFPRGNAKWDEVSTGHFVLRVGQTRGES